MYSFYDNFSRIFEIFIFLTKLVYVLLLSFDLFALSSDKVEVAKAEQDTANEALSSDEKKRKFSYQS